MKTLLSLFVRINLSVGAAEFAPEVRTGNVSVHLEMMPTLVVGALNMGETWDPYAMRMSMGDGDQCMYELGAGLYVLRRVFMLSPVLTDVFF